MPKRVYAIVKPELLRWARASSGIEAKDAARRLSVSEERLLSWETGEARPTVTQLRNLGRVYKRPIAVFFLPEPPKDFQVLHDYRRLPGRVSGVLSPELRQEIRIAIARTNIATELFTLSHEKPPSFQLRASTGEVPALVAERIRNALGADLEDQKMTRPGHETLAFWRRLVEDAGVLVFQFANVPVSEARGFALSSGRVRAIAINTKDTPNARIFTIAHELTHLSLGETGLCDLNDREPRERHDLDIEVFCNGVAGEMLVPTDALSREPEVKRKRALESWDDADIRALSARYGVSREVVLRRLLTLGRTTARFYERKSSQFLKEYAEWAKQRSTGFAPPFRKSLASVGATFGSLVLETYRQRLITASDVSTYLGLKLNHLGKFEAALSGALEHKKAS